MSVDKGGEVVGAAPDAVHKRRVREVPHRARYGQSAPPVWPLFMGAVIAPVAACAAAELRRGPPLYQAPGNGPTTDSRSASILPAYTPDTVGQCASDQCSGKHIDIRHTIQALQKRPCYLSMTY